MTYDGKRLIRFRSFWMFPLLAVCLVCVTFGAEPRRPYRDLLWLFAIGVFLWTLLEYGLHRFLFHIRAVIANPRLREFINASHYRHHAAPSDPSKLLVHPSCGLVVSAMLFGIIYVASGTVSATVGLSTGVWAGFLYYETVHYLVHFNVSNSRLIVRQRRLHFYHHFRNHKRCFGVTSPGGITYSRRQCRSNATIVVLRANASSAGSQPRPRILRRRQHKHLPIRPNIRLLHSRTFRLNAGSLYHAVASRPVDSCFFERRHNVSYAFRDDQQLGVINSTWDGGYNERLAAMLGDVIL